MTEEIKTEGTKPDPRRTQPLEGALAKGGPIPPRDPREGNTPLVPPQRQERGPAGPMRERTDQPPAGTRMVQLTMDQYLAINARLQKGEADAAERLRMVSYLSQTLQNCEAERAALAKALSERDATINKLNEEAEGNLLGGPPIPGTMGG